MKNINKILKNIIIFFCYFIYNLLAPIFIIKLTNNVQLTLFIKDIIYILFLLIAYKNELIDDFKNFKFKNFIKYIPIFIVGITIMFFTNILISNIIHTKISTNEALIRKYIKIMPIYMCLNSVIYAPFVEEITFRKTFRNIFNNKYFFILISGIMFGLIHMSLSNNIYNELFMVIPYIIVGIDLSYIYYKSNNIFTNILIHSIYNLILFSIQIIGG